MPVILRLPFLIHNMIITDHASQTCIDKNANYDLLNPLPVSPPPPPKLHLCEKLVEIKADKKLMLAELMLGCNDHLKSQKRCPHVTEDSNVVGAIHEQIEILSTKETLAKRDTDVRTEFKEVFEPILHVNEPPTNVFASIKLKDSEKTIKSCSHPLPWKYKEAWGIIIQQHLDTDHIQPSASPCASPAFIVPKVNPNVLPHWINDYCQLNENTIMDSHPIPQINNILADCAKGKIWGTIDMTNSFFQTCMHPDHIHLTAVNMPFGLYEWLVMPMGLKNAPVIHQHRVTAARRELIGKICDIYLEDIVIWSQLIEEHSKNVKLVLKALKDAHLYVNLDKTHLFCLEIDFLGHHISTCGIEADNKKADRILNWPVLKSVTETRSFLGLVWYLADFLHSLAEHTGILTELTTTASEKHV